MSRGVILILATALFVAGDVAWADSSEPPVRLPITSARSSPSFQVTVRPGDHLWKISARYLSEADSGTSLAPYWREVIEMNLPNLRSGNPDLIYPGEIVTMPTPAG